VTTSTGSFEPPSRCAVPANSPRTWSRRPTLSDQGLRNTWYSHLRAERQRRATAAPDDAAPEELATRSTALDPQASLEASEVLEALAVLPQAYREAVAAVDVAGLSYAEAAKALGVRQGTIMSRVYRGREQVEEAVGAV
jgi:RNA polymerase sigma-70 factor, ECF subfamily